MQELLIGIFCILCGMVFGYILTWSTYVDRFWSVKDLLNKHLDTTQGKGEYYVDVISNYIYRMTFDGTPEEIIEEKLIQVVKNSAHIPK
jgi:hypothetical protein